MALNIGREDQAGEKAEDHRGHGFHQLDHRLDLAAHARGHEIGRYRWRRQWPAAAAKQHGVKRRLECAEGQRREAELGFEVGNWQRSTAKRSQVHCNFRTRSFPIKRSRISRGAGYPGPGTAIAQGFPPAADWLAAITQRERARWPPARSARFDARWLWKTPNCPVTSNARNPLRRCSALIWRIGAWPQLEAANRLQAQTRRRRHGP